MHSRDIKETLFPWVPSNVEIEHLFPNGKLLSDVELTRVQRDFTQDGRYTKKDSACGYPIIVQDGEYWAVYLGLQHAE